jgi:hypothetical protein
MTTLEYDKYKLPTIRQGTDWTFQLTLSTQVDNDPPVPVNLTGYSALFQLRRTPLHPQVISLANGSGITLGGVAGTIALEISDTLSEEVAPGVYQYDLRLTDTGGKNDVVLAGEVEVRARISR